MQRCAPAALVKESHFADVSEEKFSILMNRMGRQDCIYFSYCGLRARRAAGAEDELPVDWEIVGMMTATGGKKTG